MTVSLLSSGPPPTNRVGPIPAAYPLHHDVMPRSSWERGKPEQLHERTPITRASAASRTSEGDGPVRVFGA